MGATHIAFADESQHNVGRFRGIGTVSFPIENQDAIFIGVQEIVSVSQVNEIKWSKIRTAQYRFAAIRIIELALKEAAANHLRIDVMVWDTEDSRHKTQGRDDNENLRRMYFILFRNILHMRWPENSTWEIFPDENSIINWMRIQGRLNTAARYIELEKEETILSEMGLLDTAGLGEDEFADRIKSFNVLGISEVNSSNALIAQVADLFVGMGVFSHQHYQCYSDWALQNSSQMHLGLFEGVKEKFTAGEKEHCVTLNHFYTQCKQNKLGVSLEREKGLVTKNPSRPVNYWLYQPQGDYDKAPLRER